MSVLLAVGSFTESYGSFHAEGEGVSLFQFDPESGGLALLDTLRGLPNPSYLRATSPGHLLAVCENDDHRAAIAQFGLQAGVPPRLAVGAAPAEAWPEEAARLEVLGLAPVPGTIPCHIDLHPGGKWAACVCYGSGDVLIYRVEERGFPGAVVSQARHAGRSVHPVRQTVPHPHAACFSPDGNWLLVPDLGTDEIWCRPFMAAKGTLGAPTRLAVPPGSGPRLLLFTPDGRHALVVFELASTVAVLRWEAGELSLGQTVPSMMTPFGGQNTAAGLRWHPSGRFFAVSNRGADSIVLFGYEAASGEIAALSEAPAGGAKPRDFEFSPCGRWLLAASQDGNSLSVISVDPQTGALRPAGIRHEVRTPSCVRFLVEA
jgi:6-phosphogluconolactonase